MTLSEAQQHEQYYDDIFEALKNEPYANYLGMELVELKAGFAKVTLSPATHMLNTHGTVHGGIIFSLADYAFAVASNSYGKTAVGVTNTINYMNASFADHQLTAIAQEVKKTRRLAWYRIDVLSNDELCATMEAMVYRKTENFIGQE
ncbi:hotdog fold thioesterase [Lysinibacillus sp. NPDC048646]|uniref:hotdog fold thioesterase n=1 Tax=Lysinibacillus sp. NPDC048646 TaxID=3390574 RepID=UPI003D090C90